MSVPDNKTPVLPVLCARPLRRRCVVFLLAVALVACGTDSRGRPDSPTGPDTPDSPAPSPDSLVIVSGNDQSAPPGASLSAPLVVRVTSAAGEAVPNRQVAFQVTRGGGTLSTSSATTDASGYARISPWTMGPVPGVNLVEAEVTGTILEVEFRATGVENPVTLSAGGDTIVYGGQEYAESVVVDSSALVAVIHDGEVYFHYAGLGAVPASLSKASSIASLKHRLGSLIQELSGGAPAPGWLASMGLTAGGVDITTDGQTSFTFSNGKRRLVGLKFTPSESPFTALMPRGNLFSLDPISWAAGRSELLTFAQASRHTRSLTVPTTCEVFGSAVVLGLIPYTYALELLLLGDEIVAAAAADPVYFAEVNVFDAVLLLFTLAEEVAGVVDIFVPCGTVFSSTILGTAKAGFMEAMESVAGTEAAQHTARELNEDVAGAFVQCGCEVYSVGVCKVLTAFLSALQSLAFVADDGIFRTYDVFSSPLYGRVVLTPNLPTGTLSLTVTGLPEGATPAVQLMGPGSFNLGILGSREITGLPPGEYTVQAWPVQHSGTQYDPDPTRQTVTVVATQTVSATVDYAEHSETQAPTVTTSAATVVGWDGFTLNGTVDPGGSPTRAWFEYSTHSDLSDPSTTPELDVGSGTMAVPFSATVTGLQSGTSYSFRAVAANEAGEARGGVLQATTALVTAAITGWAGTTTSVQEDQQGTIQYTFTNTGNVTWTFGAGATLRKPDGSEVDLGLQAVTVGAGASQTVTWTHTFDAVGAWDVRGAVWKESSAPSTNLADSGWREDVITVTAQPVVVVTATLDNWNGTSSSVEQGQSGTVQYTFTNTGNVTWTFGAGATLRKPDGSEVDLGLQAVTVGAGASQTVTWTHTFDAVGAWDVRGAVWKESSAPSTNLADSGWREDVITVTAQPVVKARFNNWDGTDRAVTEGETGTIRFQFSNEGDQEWTFGMTATLRKPDDTEVPLALQTAVVAPGALGSASWDYMYDIAGAWDVKGTIWKESSSPTTVLAETSYQLGYITVAAADVVAARIDGWSGTTASLEEGEAATIRVNFTNTGNVPWAFGVQAWLRAPNGTEIDLGQQPAAAGEGQSTYGEWTRVLDQVGTWDVRAVVWKEDPDGTTELANSGWVEDQITVTAAPVISADITGFLVGDAYALDQEGQLRLTFTNTSDQAWTFGAQMLVRKPDDTEVDLGVQAVNVNAGQSTYVAFPFTPDVVGSWDYMGIVWKESAAPVSTSLDQSGWEPFRVVERLGRYIHDWSGGAFSLGATASAQYQITNNTARPYTVLWCDLVVRKPDGNETVVTTKTFYPLYPWATGTVSGSFTVDQAGGWDAKAACWADEARSSLVIGSDWQENLVTVADPVAASFVDFAGMPTSVSVGSSSGVGITFRNTGSVQHVFGVQVFLRKPDNVRWSPRRWRRTPWTREKHRRSSG